MRAIRRSVAALLVLAVSAGLVPLPAFAGYIERVYQPDGTFYRQIVHDDGTVTVLGSTVRSYDYDTVYNPPSYHSSYYDPNYYGYYGGPGYGPSYYGGSGAVLGGAALGYAIGRGVGHHR